MTLKQVKYFALTKSYGQYINFLSLISPEKAAIKAFELFSHPRKGKIKVDKIPNILLEAQHETFVLDENQFQVYVWKGNKEIIMLVHGWESNASRWKKMLPYLLETGKTIVAIDAPAHGLSAGNEFTVPRYVTAINELTKKYNPDYLIGHSIGGASIVYYQYLYKNPKLKKIVLLGAPSDLVILYHNFCNLLSLNKKVRTELEKQFSSKVNMKIDDFSGKKFAPFIETKTLIIHDKGDLVVSVIESEKLSTHWKNSELMTTENFGHGLNNKKVFTKIVSFITTN